MFHYGYFVICQNGRLATAGDDWGPTTDSYKPGDELGTKNGVKAIVVDVIKGQEDWVREAMQAFEYREQEERTDPDTALILTNFGWYFTREPKLAPGEFMVARHENPQYEVAEETWKLLARALSEYGLVIDEDQYRSIDHARQIHD